jgi:Putative peptidoglycan binding domain
VATFSPIAAGQDPPGLVKTPDGTGYGCSMTWQEQPPNSTLLRANLLLYTKEKMSSEMDRVGYSCDPTPDVVPGWPEAFTCDRMSADGPASLIWLDKDGQSVSLSIRGDFAEGFTPQDVVDIMVIVLGPNGTVTAPVVPVVPPTIAAAPSTTGSTIARLPSETWNGKYVVEPASGALQIGDRGDRVKELQRNLGFAELLDPPYDGYFGPDTEQAVVEFQRQAGFPVDGIASEAVLKAVQPD